MAYNNINDIAELGFYESETEGEIADDIPDTSCGDFRRPILYTTDQPPQEILNINAKNFKADIIVNADSSVFYESRSVAKNLTGIAANSTLTEKSTVADSLGGIAAYTNVGFFTSFIHPFSNGAFANSLATNGNGNLIIVGNKTFSSDGYYVGVGTTTGRSTFYGIAYMFERTNSNNFVNRGYVVGRYSKVGYGATHQAGTGTTTQGYGYSLPNYQTPISFAGDDFGHSVAMSADGKTVVVGGPNITGESYVGIATTTINQVVKDQEITIERPSVGVVWIYDFSASGSCGSGYFERVAKFEGEEEGDLFGQSVAISADAKIVVVGATDAGVYNEGYAYVYERNDNSYSQVGILTAYASTDFGSAVSVSADGNTIVVGDSTEQYSFVFDRDEDDIDNDNGCGIFELVATLSTGGTKVCISDDGQTIITADASNSTVYDRLGDTFTSRGTLTGGSVAVTCSSDGKVITTASASAYRVYNREGNTFYLNHTGSSTINSFDMSTNTKTLYRGITSEDKVYCDDQSLETFVYTDASGNVGIATSTPTALLHVNGSTTIEGTFKIPNQPSFRVYLPTAAVSNIITFGATAHNIGNHMNASTGVFTAPVAGRYLFTFAILSGNPLGSYVRINFCKNSTTIDTTLGDALWDGLTTYGSPGMAMIFNLAANDTIRLKAEGSPVYGTSYGSFSGCLIG